MFPASWNNLQKGLSDVRAFARTGDALRKLLTSSLPQAEASPLRDEVGEIAQGAPGALEWRISDYVAAISRTYALYENYVDDLLTAWIELRVTGVKYADLPTGWRKEYEAGFAYVLPLAGDGRYEHLTHEAMVTEHAKALAGEGAYRTFPDCFTYRTSNLRLDVLNQIISRCEISGFSEWIDLSESLREFFGHGGSIRDRTQKRLKEFVQFRNDASHSAISVDQIVGVDQVIEFADFIEALCKTLRDKVHFVASDFLISVERARHVGRITEVFSDNIVVGTLDAVTLTNGDQLLIRSGRMCAYRVIESLRMDDEDVPTVTVGTPAKIGIKFDDKVRLSDTVIIILPAANSNPDAEAAVAEDVELVAEHAV